MKTYINCLNGTVRNDVSGTTCEAACQGSCCNGTQACYLFTGNVAKDGSCYGYQACSKSHIPLVVNSCKATEKACFKVGNYQRADANTLVGSIVNSCNGVKACAYISNSNSDFGGKVGDVQDSCNDENACYAAGMTGGSIGNITSSCHGRFSCKYVGYNNGAVGNIVNSCNNMNSCCGAGFQGKIGDIQGSCSGYLSCTYAGSYSTAPTGVTIGVLGSIVNSCHGNYSCHWLGLKGIVGGNVRDSCNDEKACLYAASKAIQFGEDDFPASVGSIGSMTSSCNAKEACFNAGSLSKVLNGEIIGKGPITSNLTSCCNTAYECKGTNQTTLPGQCVVTSEVRRELWCHGDVLCHFFGTDLSCCFCNTNRPNHTANNTCTINPESIEQSFESSHNHKSIINSISCTQYLKSVQCPCYSKSVINSNNCYPNA